MARRRWVKKGTVSRGWRKTGRLRRRHNPLGRGITNEFRQMRLSISALIPVTILNNAIGSYARTQYIIPLNYPTMYRDPSGTYGQIPNFISTQWSHCFGDDALFDQYRVMGLYIKFAPSHVETAVSTAAYDINDTPSIVYQFNDIDDSSLVSIPEESNFLNRGVLPQSYTVGKDVHFRFIQPKKNRNQWLNSQNYSQSPDIPPGDNSEIQGFNQVHAAMKLMFVNAGTGAAVVGKMGRLYVKWDCIFRGVRPDA